MSFSISLCQHRRRVRESIVEKLFGTFFASFIGNRFKKHGKKDIGPCVDKAITYENHTYRI